MLADLFVAIAIPLVIGVLFYPIDAATRRTELETRQMIDDEQIGSAPKPHLHIVSNDPSH